MSSGETIFTACFDPLERRGIPDLVWVATGDGVQLVLKKVSYKQKTVFAHEKIQKNRHNSVSRPSLGMTPGPK